MPSSSRLLESSHNPENGLTTGEADSSRSQSTKLNVFTGFQAARLTSTAYAGLLASLCYHLQTPFVCDIGRETEMISYTFLVMTFNSCDVPHISWAPSQALSSHWSHFGLAFFLPVLITSFRQSGHLSQPGKTT